MEAERNGGGSHISKHWLENVAKWSVCCIGFMAFLVCAEGDNRVEPRTRDLLHIGEANPGVGSWHCFLSHNLCTVNVLFIHVFREEATHLSSVEAYAFVLLKIPFRETPVAVKMIKPLNVPLDVQMLI